jgi:hypothetical protein
MIQPEEVETPGEVETPDEVETPGEVEPSRNLLSSRAKTRDPLRTTAFCKDRRHALDPGSRPG